MNNCESQISNMMHRDVKLCPFASNETGDNISTMPNMLQNVTEEFVSMDRLSRMFYLVKPSDYVFESAENIPNLYKEAWPYFISFIILENILRWIQGKTLIRVNDGIVSLSHGILFECSKCLSKGMENWLYISIYEKYHILNLPWNSVLVWYITALGVDFCYYWLHRASHEIHILWAQHQVHHSSENFNLAVGLRQSILHAWGGFVFYLPMAFFIPPVYFLMHQQFNLLYQFWLHTEVVNTLGPLEYIFNTPNHHRIHHGSNTQYLDKNYGGVLIIWDRLFGTFYQSQKSQEITYGLVYQPPKFNPFYQQIFYYQNVYTKWKSMNKWSDKLYAIIKGPSWTPGSKWTGDTEKKQNNVESRIIYDVKLPLWSNIYLLIHFILIVVNCQEIIEHSQVMNATSTLLSIACIFVSFAIIGTILDACENACYLEGVRCVIMFLIYTYLHPFELIKGQFHFWTRYYITCFQIIYGISSLFWLTYYIIPRVFNRMMIQI